MQYFQVFRKFSCGINIMNKTETKSSWSQADVDWSDGDQVVNFFNDGDSVDKF